MRIVKRYMVLEATSGPELGGMVEEKIKEGWQPWGEMQSNGVVYIQTIVKYEED